MKNYVIDDHAKLFLLDSKGKVSKEFVGIFNIVKKYEEILSDKLGQNLKFFNGDWTHKLGYLNESLELVEFIFNKNYKKNTEVFTFVLCEEQTASEYIKKPHNFEHYCGIFEGVARFRLAQAFAIPRTITSCHSHVRTHMRKKGVGTLLNKMKIELLQESAEFARMICTVNKENIAQKLILEKNGWTKDIENYMNYTDLWSIKIKNRYHD